MNENELKERLRAALEPVVIDDSGSNVVDDLYAVMVDIARAVAKQEIERMVRDAGNSVWTLR